MINTIIEGLLKDKDILYESLDEPWMEHLERKWYRYRLLIGDVFVEVYAGGSIIECYLFGNDGIQLNSCLCKINVHDPESFNKLNEVLDSYNEMQ